MITFWHWHTEPLLLGGILLFAWIYATCVYVFRPRIASDATPKIGQTLWFYAGLLTFYIAVGSPIDAIGENYLFWVHMFQHILLMYVCPPMLIMGIPAWLIDNSFGRYRFSAWCFRWFVHPVVSGAGFTIIFSAWHVPDLYEWALQDKSVHIIEHLSVFLPSLGVWWCFMSPSKKFPQLAGGLQMLFIFALMIGQLPVFAFLVFANQVYYPTYFYAPRIMALTAMEDQVMGGVVMKLANLIVSVVIFGKGFYHLARDSEAIDNPA